MISINMPTNFSMSKKRNQSAEKRYSLRKKFSFVKDYFVNSDEKLIAWTLLIGSALCVIGFVAILAGFAWWSAGFWAVLTAKTLAPFLTSMINFTFLIGSFVSVNVIKNYLVGKLSIRWRNWLTHKIINKLFDSENNYLDLKRFSNEIDNFSQRIQEDIKKFVDLSLTLGLDFLRSILSFATFASTLWIVGGPLTVAVLGLNLIIPGYLLWAALIFSVIATITTHLIGKSLAEKNKKGERIEADLRQDLETLNSDAENIAEEHAENYYRNILKTKISDLNENAHHKLNTKSKLVAFQNFYLQFAGVFPLLLSAPVYFSGLIDIGQLMQISMAFSQVNSSLSWFVEAYEQITRYKTSIERILELEDIFNQEGLLTNTKSISRKENNHDKLKLKSLTLLKPQIKNQQCIMRNLNLKLNSGEHTLIKGTSGLGKSTLFKVISGTWLYGEGQVSIPAGKRLYFLPQKPTIPQDSLMAVLAYPDPINTYTEEQYVFALKAVGGMDEFVHLLKEKRAWSKELSGGQQQRISFARAILKKPDWLFLDEATASLDEESEHQVYTAIQNLKNTTIVSIAHRQSVDNYHGRTVFFTMNETRDVTVHEMNNSFNKANIVSNATN